MFVLELNIRKFAESIPITIYSITTHTSKLHIIPKPNYTLLHKNTVRQKNCRFTYKKKKKTVVNKPSPQSRLGICNKVHILPFNSFFM